MARGVACGLFGALLPLGPRIEEVEVGARGKVAKTAAQHDCPAARLLRRGEFGKQHAHQLGSDEIIRSEEHTSELQSLMRISYAVFCLKKKKNKNSNNTQEQ